MADLVTWLEQQITEDERAAQRGTNRWKQNDGHNFVMSAIHQTCDQRVLAECEAKRRRVALLGKVEQSSNNYASSIAYELLCTEALPFADRPGYDETWRP